MKLGFLTTCLPNRSLEQIAAWASENAFEALEVAAWPDLGDRPFTATHIRVESFSDRDAESVRALFDHHGLTLSSLSFYDNNLHPDPADRAAINKHVAACIDAAAQLGVPIVGTLVGRDPTKSVAENLREAEWMFSLGLYLNFDPSHLMWMGIDPVAALRPYVDRIPHAQAKDIELFDGVLSVEHEDPLWGGTEDKIETGLRVAHRTLRPLLVV